MNNESDGPHKTKNKRDTFSKPLIINNGRGNNKNKFNILSTSPSNLNIPRNASFSFETGVNTIRNKMKRYNTSEARALILSTFIEIEPAQELQVSI
jgi:hypothetical protein